MSNAWESQIEVENFNHNCVTMYPLHVQQQNLSENFKEF